MKHILLTIVTIFLATTSMIAQDLIVPKKGNPITAYNIDAGGNFIYYTAESDANAALQRIAKDSVLMVRKADGTVMDFAAASTNSQSVPATVEKPKIEYPVINETDIHGSLIAQGNKVFIPTNGYNECERAGQEQIKKLVSEWDYWTVVDSPEQAHFVLQFVVTSIGEDYSWLFVRPRKYYNSKPYFERLGSNIGVLVCVRRTDDSDPQRNLMNADIFFNHLKGMLSDPDYEQKATRRNRQASESFKDKRSQKYLNADNKSNDYGYQSVYSTELHTLD